jgi:hypothetical protein
MRALVGLLAVALAAPAVAQDFDYRQGPPGPVLTGGLLLASARRLGDSTWRTGLGGELALVSPIAPRAFIPLIGGGWFQLQGVEAFSGPTRLGGGARLQAWFVGVDGGLALQSAAQGRDATIYAVLAPTLLLGPGALGVRWSWPISSGARWPREIAVLLTVRFPLLSGERGRRRDGDDD